LRKPIQSLRDLSGLPIHELVQSIFKSGRLAYLRLPSLAGSGLPERMRSTVFALLGMTAAAGLALVAIFAQPGFPLLEPVPLPNQPPARQGVADARALPVGHGRSPLGPAASRQSTALRPSGDGSRDGVRAEGGPESGAVAPEVVSPVQAPTPVAEAPEGSGGGGHGSRGGAATPAPPATPQPASKTAPTPVSTPKPVEPAPEAITSSAGHKVAEAPGSSNSAAAAEHASERGVEASSKGPGPAAPQASAQTAASATGPASGPAPSGQGNAFAKGQTK
jgi:hypothetical protein